MEKMDMLVKDEEAMLELGQKLARVLAGGDILYLSGELGAGKTTLVRGIAKGLGYQGRVNSPTFTLMNIYNSDPPLYHLDFYRLEDGDLDDLGLDDYWQDEAIIAIEWPQRAANKLPGESLQINIELVDDDYEKERKVTLKAQGDKYIEKIARLMASADFSC